MRFSFALLILAGAVVAPCVALAADAPGRHQSRVYEREVEREVHVRPRVERRVVVEEEEPDEYVVVRRRWIDGLSTRHQERVFTREDRDDAWANSYEWDSHRIPDRDW